LGQLDLEAALLVPLVLRLDLLELVEQLDPVVPVLVHPVLVLRLDQLVLEHLDPVGLVLDFRLA
jgi:hypothetical protein